MLIRTEAPADILAIDRLLKSAFDTDAEAQLVMSLRENSRLTLSLVACSDEGEVIGHVMFTPVTLNGEDLNWQGLAPLAVAKAHRGQGIASALIKEGFESLLMFGYPVCVVLGNPDYYQRFGFQPAEQYQMRCPWDVPVGAFQICELAEGMLNNRSGLIEYSPEFTQ
ncbi:MULTISPECIES: GNAT family N-acetyltransferase [Vibrio]|uniref:Putative N-acetyltransferase n=1 Tax=Vibrio proteolyticus NBRC 13287 TaxID=1219065 RepID=U3BM42_VIBPR|nr:MULTISPECIES: N-acetyltransferase [Vibrio]NAX22463.1 GNAT family N-acetyltransferase [Vibrio sp. V39_P1S14PM300]GAD67683.1 putative N-acetyltransferase [Vibrio proteolyticus NBRC 13287]